MNQRVIEQQRVARRVVRVDAGRRQDTKESAPVLTPTSERAGGIAGGAGYNAARSAWQAVAEAGNSSNGSAGGTVRGLAAEIVSPTDYQLTSRGIGRRASARGGIIGYIDGLLTRVGAWYRAVDTAFIVGACVVIMLLGVVIRPGSALITHTMQPPAFTLLPVEGGYLQLYISTPPIALGELEALDAADFGALRAQEFTIQGGQTLSEIAEIHNISMSTLASFNKVSNARTLQAGAVYRVPDREGLLHTIKTGDTVATLAKQYGVSEHAILDTNNLESGALSIGEDLFVPGASLGDFDLRLVLGELFAWPVGGSRFTSGFGYRRDPFTGIRRFHYGIDLVGSRGAPIRAAMEGRVSYVGEQSGGYGKYVIIKHPGGFQTLYAHLSGHNTRSGSYVARGEVIGWQGNTGRSTGEHLHFSIIHNGKFVNPRQYLY